MSKTILIAAFIIVGSCMFANPSCSADPLPAQIRAGEHRLILNGSGARKKNLLELYVAGLYLKTPSNSSSQIITADEPMSIRIKITSGFVSQSNLVESLEVGFNNATGGDTQNIRKEIDRFRECFKDEIKKGDVFDIVYLPQHGVVVNKNGKLKGSVTGANFKQALFSIWLSDTPADNDLKQALLTPPKVR